MNDKYGGNTSLLDVFRGAAGVGSQMLDMYSREKKYKLDNDLYEVGEDGELVAHQLAQDFLKVDGNGENEFQKNPDLYKDHINKTLQQWRDRSLAKGNNSQYFNDNFRRMELQVRGTLEKKLYEAQITAGRQQLAIANAKRKSGIVNDENLTAIQKLEALNQADADAGNLYDDVGKYKAEVENFVTAYKSSMKVNDDGKVTTAEAAKLIADNAEEFEKLAIERFGMSADELVENKNELIADYQQAAMGAVRDRNYNTYNTEAERYKWLVKEVRERRAAGQDVREYRIAAMELYRWGNEEKRKGVYSSEYHQKDWAKMEPEFAWDDVLGARPAGGSGGGGGGRETLPPHEFFESIMYKTIEDVVTGKAGVSMADLDAGEGSGIMKNTVLPQIRALAEAGNTDAQKTVRWIEENGELTFLTRLGYSVLENANKYYPRLIAEDAPTAKYLTQDVSKLIKTRAAERGGKYGSLTEWEFQHLEQMVRDIAWEDKNGIGTEEYRKIIDTQLDYIVAGGIHKKPIFGPSAGNEKSMLNAGWAIINDPTSVYTFLSNGETLFRDAETREYVNKYSREEKEMLKAKYGDLSFVTYMHEPGSRSDIVGIGIYQDKSGNQYRAVPKKDVATGGLYFRDETREVQSDGTLGAWGIRGERDGSVLPHGGTPQGTPTAREQQHQERLESMERDLHFAPNDKTPGGMPRDVWLGYDQNTQISTLRRLAADPKNVLWGMKPASMPDSEFARQWGKKSEDERVRLYFQHYGQNR